MPEILSVIVAFFAALGVISLGWIVATLISAPRRGSELRLFCTSRAAGDIEADLRRVAWLRKAGDMQVTLMLLEDNLPDELWQTAEGLSRRGDLQLVSREGLIEHILAGEDRNKRYERNT